VCHQHVTANVSRSVEHVVLCSQSVACRATAHSGNSHVLLVKNSSMFHFKGDTIVAWRLLVQMKHTQINECAPTGDCRLLFSLWNQRRPLPKNLLLLWLSKRCMIVKYWLRKLKTSCSVRLFAEKIAADKGLKETLWVEVCEAVVCFWVQPTGRPRETERQAELF